MCYEEKQYYKSLTDDTRYWIPVYYFKLSRSGQNDQADMHALKSCQEMLNTVRYYNVTLYNTSPDSLKLCSEALRHIRPTRWVFSFNTVTAHFKNCRAF